MNTENLITFAQDLIQIPSLSGEESDVVKRIKTEMEKLGFDRVQIDRNGSIIGTVTGAHPGKTILMDGHCDTVGISDPTAWSHDPFGRDVADGHLYGRGASDMKGALAAMIYAAGHLDRSKVHGTVCVSATVVEELMEGESIKEVVSITKPDYVIIGEATELRLNRGGRGRAEIKLETFGKTAHSSSPQLGENAVLAMCKAVQALDGIKLEENTLMGNAQIVLTDIISRPYPGSSVIPDHCQVTYDRRLLPADTKAGVLADMENVLSDLGIRYKLSLDRSSFRTYTGVDLTCEKFFPGWEFPETHELVQAALRGLRNAGQKPPVSAYRFCTNAAYTAGTAGIPSIGYGPGKEGYAHIVDEPIAINEVIQAADGYSAMLYSILG